MRLFKGTIARYNVIMVGQRVEFICKSNFPTDLSTIQNSDNAQSSFPQP
jgi:hypothetical protein